MAEKLNSSKTLVWRDRLQRWFSPLARRCPISPNGVTLAALLLQLIAAVCLYFGGRRPVLFLVAIAFIIVGGLADAFDGIVAREQGRETRFGDFLDHFADRVADLFLAAAWIIGNDVRCEIEFAALVTIMLNGYIGTQIEATWREREYESIGRAEFVLALIVYPIISYNLHVNGWHTLQLSGLTIAEWLAVLMALFAAFGIVQRFMLAARLERT